MPRKVLAVVLVAFIAITVIAFQLIGRSRQLPEGLIQANGRIEGDTIIVASRHAGRISAIHVREGDDAVVDQVLVELDDTATRARVAEAEAAIAVAEAELAQCRAEYEVLCREVPYQIAGATAAVAANEAFLEQAIAEEEQAQRERDRYAALAETNAIDRETAEQAELRWRQARDQLAAATAALQQAREALNSAELGPARIRAKAAQIVAYEAGVRGAEARLDEVRSVLEDLTISSPVDGSVTMRLADLGEVVSAGSPLLEIVDLDRLYVKVFIPQVDIGRVRIGLPAKVYIDAFPADPFDAEVRSIASRAEFTPKEIQTPDERVKLVYAVEVYLRENPDHRLTPGLPADVVIRWQEGAPWAPPRW